MSKRKKKEKEVPTVEPSEKAQAREADSIASGTASDFADCQMTCAEVLRTRRFWELNLAWLPHALFVLFLILRYTVNLPSVDQWDYEINFLKAFSEHGFRFSDLIAQQLEHRIAANNLVALVNAIFFRWDAQLQCVFLWSMVGLLGCGLAFLSVTGSENRRWVQLIQMTSAGLLLFGVSQYASWNNSASITWFFIECSLMAAMVLSRVRMEYTARVLIHLLIAAATTFSTSTGMMMWGLFLPFLWVTRPREGMVLKKMSVLWFSAAILCIGRYFYGYQKPPDGPSISAGLSQPLRLAQFFFANLGSPYAKGTSAAPEVQGAWVGAIVFAAFALGLGYVWKKRHDRRLFKEALPWTMLGIYCLLMGMAISVGRFGSGFREATESRFVNTQVLLSIALIYLLPLVVRHARGAGGANPSMLDSCRSMNVAILGASGMSALASALVVLHLVQSVGTIDRQPYYRRIFLGSKAGLQFIQHFKDEQQLRWTWARGWEEFLPKVEFAASKGYLALAPSVRVCDLIAPDSPNDSESTRFGAMEQAGQAAPSVIALSGWAVDPVSQMPADAVLLSWESPSSDPVVFGIAQPANLREDLVEKTGVGEYRWAGWVRYLDTRGFPKSEVTIRAWAYDTLTLKIRALRGQFVHKPQ